MSTTSFNWATFQIPPSFQQRCSSPVADDELMGAYLLSSINSKHVQTCANCGTSQTPLWRKGWYDQLLNKHVMLCNACGLKYAKNQYCPYCKYIYKMNQDVHAQREQWLNCTQCRRWVHSDCEKKYICSGMPPLMNEPNGQKKPMELDFNQMLAQPAIVSQDWNRSQCLSNGPYMCPDCKRDGANAAMHPAIQTFAQTTNNMN
eukprot:TRINITY_DN15185_c0_g1_i1.p1 TRINITY_DN15185_c0_g1~~TRINITY_DN15185_c0_g1_i1.p1  ORF type:complete len:203 (+),score=35.33 TRINITY_DN15185_c0_g1_i1:192-800(+)